MQAMSCCGIELRRRAFVAREACWKEDIPNEIVSEFYHWYAPTNISFALCLPHSRTSPGEIPRLPRPLAQNALHLTPPHSPLRPSPSLPPRQAPAVLLRRCDPAPPSQGHSHGARCSHLLCPTLPRLAYEPAQHDCHLPPRLRGAGHERHSETLTPLSDFGLDEDCGWDIYYARQGISLARLLARLPSLQVPTVYFTHRSSIC